MHALTDPFTPVYLQRAWLELALLSIPAGTLGAFVVLRRLAFATHALGVGTFPGVVVAFGVGFSAFAGGLGAALVFAALLAILQRRRDLDAPASTGLLLAGALALGSLLVSGAFSAGARVDTLLFGSLFGVTHGDLARTAAVAAVTLVAFAILGRGWLVVAFDRETAPALGFSPGRLDAALLLLLAVAVVASVDAVGSLLVSALLVVPAATARLVTRRLVPLAACSSLVALAVATAGLALSFHTGAPPGATIAALAAGLFVLVFAARSLADAAQRRHAFALGAAALAAIGLAACGGGSDSTGVGLEIVATTTQVADWARNVGGDRVQIVRLLKPNVDPHDYEPTPVDVAAVARARLVLASGAGLDRWIADVVANAGGGARLVELAPTSKLESGALGEGGGPDPHYWQDPTLVIEAVGTLERALAEADPSDAATFEANAGRFVRRLESLDAQLAKQFAAIPPDRRTMVADHDAFGYLARRFGLVIVGAAIPSMSTAAEPSAKETAALIDTIRREGVRALFSESSVDPKLIRQIAAETGAKVYPSLYGDTLGPAGSDAQTYIGMMRHNADVLVEGLTR